MLVHIFSLIFWRAEDIVVDTYFHGILESLEQQGVIDHVNQVEVHHHGGWGLVQQQVWRYTEDENTRFAWPFFVGVNTTPAGVGLATVDSFFCLCRR